MLEFHLILKMQLPFDLSILLVLKKLARDTHSLGKTAFTIFSVSFASCFIIFLKFLRNSL